MPDTIELSLDGPQFSLTKDEYGDRYSVRFSSEAKTVTVRLSSAALETFIRQADKLIPSPRLELGALDIDTSWREAAWPLKQLANNGWRHLLREVPINSVLCVLWFLKDRKLAHTVLNNMSQRAAAMTLEDLVRQYQGRDPDACSPEDAENARQCLEVVLGTLRRLVDEGTIREDLSA